MHKWYTGSVTITITATDTGGSGLASIEYSLDGGQTVHSYDRPITVRAEDVPAIMVKAIDRAGNEQPTLTTTFIGPQRSYLPILIRR